MIRHCVFIRFKSNVSQSEIDVIFAEIAALKSRLLGFIAVYISANTSPEIGMDKGYAQGFIVDFDNAASRDAYLADPEHQATGAKIVAAAEGGLDGILVYDLEIAN